VITVKESMAHHRSTFFEHCSLSS